MTTLDLSTLSLLNNQLSIKETDGNYLEVQQ